MGGEKADIDDDGLHYKGSPPRGRGKGGDIVGGLGCVRITPAWAGKSLFCFTAAVPIQDHPRIGGEKGLGSQVTQLSQGSPPRRRGKDAVVAVVVRGAGITPAWAGKSICLALPITAPRDHPRVGGEKLRCMCTCVWTWGSPPRGRGKAFIRMGAGLAAGITPAWAGKRSWVHSICRFPQDHPRVGGEKPAVAAHVRAQLGSPPRGRGKDYPDCPEELRFRITPAWAGKRISSAKPALTHRDHPRVGGEKQVPETHVSRTRGSPPRGRGKD